MRTHLLGDALRNRYGGDPAGLGDHDGAVIGKPGLEKISATVEGVQEREESSGRGAGAAEAKREREMRRRDAEEVEE